MAPQDAWRAAQLDEESKPRQPVADWAPLVRAVEEFDGGRCFHASADASGGHQLRIDGFGAAVEPFERLDRWVQEVHGVEPLIYLHLVAESQCAAVDFLAAVRPYTETAPVLKLDSDRVRRGDTLKGKVTNVGDRQLSLLLVDEQGMVYGLDHHLRYGADGAAFNIRLVGFESEDPLPQLILTLASSSETDLPKPVEPAPAGSYFPGLLTAIRDSGGKVGVAMEYFRLGG